VEQQVFADLAAFAVLELEVEFQFSGAGGLEIFDAQRMEPGGQANAAAHLLGRVQSVVINQLAAVEEEPAAVVRGRMAKSSVMGGDVTGAIHPYWAHSQVVGRDAFHWVPVYLRAD
jgi:hypothetical protein